jgi:anti-sigma B factor antagonist
MLNINKNLEGEKLSIALEGRLDTVTAPEFEAELKDSLDAITELVMDMKDLEYISSAGLRVLLTAHKSMNQKGSMKLINVNETVMEIFDVTGFVDILTIA